MYTFSSQSFQEMDFDIKPKEAEEFILKFSSDVASRAALQLERDSTLRPLLSISFRRVAVNVMNLMYDRRFSVGVEEVTVVDNNADVIAHIRTKASPENVGSESHGYSHKSSTLKSKRKTGKSTVSKKGREGGGGEVTVHSVEAEAATSAANKAETKGVLLTFVEQDHDFGWGNGGRSTTFLSSSCAIFGDSDRTRDQHIGLKFQTLDLFISTDNMSSIISSLSDSLLMVGGALKSSSTLDTFPSVRRFLSYSMSAGSSHNLFDDRPEITPSSEILLVTEKTMNLSFGKTCVTLVQGNRLYMRLRSEQLSVQIHTHKEVGHFTNVTSESFIAEDLTPGGQHFPTVIKRVVADGGNPENGAPPPSDNIEGPNDLCEPAISVLNLVTCARRQENDEGVGVGEEKPRRRMDIKTNGLHVIFTNRFLDMALNFNRSAISPMISTFSRLSQSVSAMLKETQPAAPNVLKRKATLRGMMKYERQTSIPNDNGKQRDGGQSPAVTNDGKEVPTPLLWTALCRNITVLLPQNSLDSALAAVTAENLLVSSFT